jgi:hypothetical protein
VLAGAPGCCRYAKAAGNYQHTSFAHTESQDLGAVALDRDIGRGQSGPGQVVTVYTAGLRRLPRVDLVDPSCCSSGCKVVGEIVGTQMFL